MELRRIQITGGGTYIISLPKKWIRRYKLKRGDSLTIEERDMGLFLTLKKEKLKKSAVITLPGNIMREITAKYMCGYDTISIVSEGNIDHSDRRIIKDVLKTLSGYEIVDEKNREITICNLLDPSELPTKKAMKRQFFVATSMQKDFLKSFLTNDPELARDVIQRDFEVDRLYFLVVRQLRTAIIDTSFAEKINVTPMECLDLRIVAKNIEQIADNIENNCINFGEIDYSSLNPKIFENVKKMSDLLIEIFQSSWDALEKKDFEKADRVLGMKKDLETLKKGLDEDILELKGKDSIYMGNIIENLAKIGELGIDIADIVIRPEG
ncbi:MAG: AbrB/MazE/SpoVT family DNA-binding domain-containing protein [Methanomicrobia archaeon]|nr:AbrB/MazE/SpoVT family DNA-binding domain-containing protein [Methanomicrobia archaeon]